MSESATVVRTQERRPLSIRLPSTIILIILCARNIWRKRLYKPSQVPQRCDFQVSQGTRLVPTLQFWGAIVKICNSYIIFPCIRIFIRQIAKTNESVYMATRQTWLLSAGKINDRQGTQGSILSLDRNHLLSLFCPGSWDKVTAPCLRRNL